MTTSSDLQLGMNLLPATAMSSHHTRIAFDVQLIEEVGEIRFLRQYHFSRVVRELKKSLRATRNLGALYSVCNC